MEYLDEIPKHRKNTKSNVSKSVKKSKHKHSYKPCRFKVKVDWHWRPEGYIIEYGYYCSICGKIGDIVSFLNTEKLKEFKTNEQELETFQLDGFRQEFIKK